MPIAQSLGTDLPVNRASKAENCGLSGAISNNFRLQLAPSAIPTAGLRMLINNMKAEAFGDAGKTSGSRTWLETS